MIASVSLMVCRNAVVDLCYLFLGTMGRIVQTVLTTLCSHIVWTALVNIRRYCDSDTPFYQGIMKWEIIDVMYTFMIYVTFTLFVCVSLVNCYCDLKFR